MARDLGKAASRMRETQKELIQIKATAYSDDRLVKAVVGPRGQLVELDLDPRLYRRPNAKALSNTIVSTIRKAADEANRLMQEALDRNLPSDLKFSETPGYNLRKLLQTHDADLSVDALEEEDHG